MIRAPTRRRFIRISAAAAAIGLLSTGRPARALVAPTVWRGTMLGAVATIELHEEDRDRAEGLIALARAEALNDEEQARLDRIMRDDAR